jgi:hypothetical protein
MSVFIQYPALQSGPDSQKAQIFEQWVLSRFSDSVTAVPNWQYDKFWGSVYAESKIKPDLLFKTAAHSGNQYFAIECKWQPVISLNAWQWSSEWQLNRFIDFEKQCKTPVFVIMGIGGRPDDPGLVYVMPLAEIKNSLNLSKDKMEPFQRRQKRTAFEWDCEREILS